MSDRRRMAGDERSFNCLIEERLHVLSGMKLFLHKLLYLLPFETAASCFCIKCNGLHRNTHTVAVMRAAGETRKARVKRVYDAEALNPKP
jgi:hypothetical protein